VGLPFHERPRAEVFAVEVEEIEQKEDEAGGIVRIGRQLDHAEGGDAVETDAAEFAVEIGQARRATPRPWRSPDIYASSRARCG